MNIDDVLIHETTLLDNKNDRNASESSVNDTYDSRNHKILVKSCLLARKKLVQYFSKTDTYVVYTVATFLDPSLKQHFWTDA